MSQLEFQDSFEPYYADPAHGGSMSERDAVKPSAVGASPGTADLKACRSRLLSVRSRLAKVVAGAAESRLEQPRSEQFRH